MIDRSFVLVQKDSNAKKRQLSLHGTLKILYQIYHSKEEKQKRKSLFFYADNLVLP
jgi:hypothetical protein